MTLTVINTVQARQYAEAALKQFDRDPGVFESAGYGVDSGGIGIFSKEALGAWDYDASDLDLYGLDKVYRHKETGQEYVQVYGDRNRYPATTICFFNYQSPLPRAGKPDKCMNDMLRDEEVERIPGSIIRNLSYNSFCSVTCNDPYMGVVRDPSSKAEAFYSRTTYGDGGYNTYHHPVSGVVLVDTSGVLYQVAENSEPEEGEESFGLDELSIRDVDRIDLGTQMTIIDPGYLGKVSDGAVHPAKGPYQIFRMDAPDGPREFGQLHQGFILVPLTAQ
jgi:hypothetical protein